MIIRKVEVGLESTQISKPTPGSRLGIVQSFVFRTHFIVPAKSCSQKERRRKQVIQLNAVCPGLTADHSLDRKRRVDEGILVRMEFGQTAEIGEKTAALSREIPR